jgi:ABC-type polar amino acid transport system ATPase subunit
MIIAKNINKKIGGKEILKNVSCSLKNGEIISIIGPSGAGKTTFLRAISLLDIPDSGSLEIGEYKYSFPDDKAKNIFPYPKLTIVFQQFFIWPHLTIRENITLALRGNCNEKHFGEIADLFQLHDFLDRYPNEVSLGQKQRAVLARALMLKPEYLLLDEVTSALDTEQSHIILSHIKQIAERGVGIIFVSHALHLASKISDKVIFLDGGMIVEEGSSAILKNPRTERLKKFIDISNKVI